MITDKRIHQFLTYLEKNGNLERFTTNLDNQKAPIHRWFPFLVGFSHKLVTETINFFNLQSTDYTLYDPFIGSGTTAVVGREQNINVIGNESNPFLFKISKIKTSNFPNSKVLNKTAAKLLGIASRKWRTADSKLENYLLRECFPLNNLKKMISLRDEIISNQDIPEQHRRYLFLALTMSVPKLSSFSINVPYLSWRCARCPEETFSTFEKNIQIICADMDKTNSLEETRSKIKIYLHDSRKENGKIKCNSVDMIFTSPPYLNNFDYGEALKVLLYFWKFSQNWPDITNKIRKPAIIAATTHYLEKHYSLKTHKEILGEDFLDRFPASSQEILDKMKRIKKIRDERAAQRTKSFDILAGLYFKDISKFLNEMYKVLKDDGLAFFIIGDSAPYGVHILTDNLIGELAVELGFSSFILTPLRVRGTKWTTLKNRHNRRLRESLLIIRK